mmetsp:Transcript_9065/g.23063  ORF Transcript_9065/g.23063 Transcript_9065/m.23063 type:complete len:80 (-) Transcript_9065:435-674(-)
MLTHSPQLDALVVETMAIMVARGSKGVTDIDREAVKVIGHLFGERLDREDFLKTINLLHATKPKTRLHAIALEITALEA